MIYPKLREQSDRVKHRRVNRLYALGKRQIKRCKKVPG